MHPSLADFVSRYEQLAVKAHKGEYFDADLEALTSEVVRQAKALPDQEWQAGVRAIRGRLHLMHQKAATEEPQLPSKLLTPENARLKAFFQDATVRLDIALQGDV